MLHLYVAFSLILGLSHGLYTGDDCDLKEHFLCEDKTCISLIYRCNGEKECSDGTDEKGCPEENLSFSCKDDEFRCSDGWCIKRSSVCDGIMDCPNWEEEKNCNCTNGQFLCKSGQCIDEQSVCNGAKDCQDGSDEICPAESSNDCDASKGRFLCKNGDCLDHAKVCNGQKDCADGSDEGTFCDGSCKTLNCTGGCLQLGGGPHCFCHKGFVLAGDNKTCNDVNECEEYGKCSQDCSNEKGSFNCSCREGYSLQADGRGCRLSAGGDPVLIISLEREIRYQTLDNSRIESIVTDVDQVIGVSVDATSERVYWTDVRKGMERIESCDFDGKNQRVILNFGLDLPEDIVVDSFGRNIYISDQRREHIAVCTTKGTACAPIITGLGKLRGLALHNRLKLVFYTDWGDEQPHIGRVDMDGSGQMTIIKDNIVWPNDVVVDEIMDRIYWSDGKLMSIESSDLNGDKRVVIRAHENLRPFSMALHEDTLFWSDWPNQVFSCNKLTGKDLKVIGEYPHHNVMGLAVYHPSHKIGVDPCYANPCSHLCLPKRPGGPGPGYVCKCPPNMALTPSDNATCLLTDKSVVILAAGAHVFEIEPHSLGKNNFVRLKSFNGKRIVDMVPNLRNSEVLLNIDHSAIYRFDLDTRMYHKILEHRNIAAFAYNSIDENLYWIDLISPPRIMVRSLKTGAEMAIVTELRRPAALIFVDFMQKLFYIDGNQLISSDPDGSNRIVISQQMLVPTIAMAFYPRENALFLADGHHGKITRLSLSDRSIKTFHHNYEAVTSLVVMNDRVYWTEKRSQQLFWASARGDQPQKMESDSLTDVMTMEDIGILAPTLENKNVSTLWDTWSCSSLGCQGFCFAIEGKAHCSCQTGGKLGPDGKSCKMECSEDELECGVGHGNNRKCIPLRYKCDGFQDCDDNFDEADCDVDYVCDPDEHFDCGDGECISKHFVCDGEDDCPSGADESGDQCKPIECDTSKFFACPNKCIQRSWQCDGENDCDDGSDEKNCTAPCEKFSCDNGRRCIETTSKCDRRPDCDDGSDEANCDYSRLKCPTGFFTCKNSKCVSLSEKCDGENDCEDGSDEEDCPPRPEVTRAPLCNIESAKCNGSVECGDWRDENLCDYSSHQNTKTCRNGKTYILSGWFCDGEKDCFDGSDEDSETCTTQQQTCNDDEFTCRSGGCILLNEVCDGLTQCSDGSDENSVKCAIACKSDSCHPHQRCQPGPQGPICKCQKGFFFNSTSQSCDDIDECQSGRSKCPQICVNTKGSYKCTCETGYSKEKNGTVCRAMGDVAQIVFVSNNTIKSVDWQEESGFPLRHELITSSNGLIGSVDFGNNEIFWTQPNDNQIWRLDLIDSKPEIWMENLQRPDKIAVDFITGNVYFSSINSSNIMVCSGDKICRVVVKAPVNLITGLVVDPRRKVMFVAGYESYGANIFPRGGVWVYGMDGSILNKHKKSGDKLAVPGGLAIDPITEKVFWTDTITWAIQATDYHGDKIWTEAFSESGPPSDIVFFEGNLIWKYGGFGQLQGFNLMSGTAFNPVATMLTINARSVTVLQEHLRESGHPNPCMHRGCSDLCLLSPVDPEKATCACPEGKSTRGVKLQTCYHDNSIDPPPGEEYPDPRGQSGDGNSTASNVISEPIHTGLDGEAVAVIVICVLASMVTCCSIVYFCKFRKNKPKVETPIRFVNKSFGLEHRKEPKPQEQELSNVKVVKRGEGVAFDNPGFETPEISPEFPTEFPNTGRKHSRFSPLEYLKYGRAPKLTRWTENNCLNEDSSSDSLGLHAKSSSTPNFERKDHDRDSAYDPSVEYEDLADINQSVAFNKDKARLIED